MPSECIANPLQRELADAIIRLQSLDEIRILLACGAKVNEPVTQGLRPLHYAVWQRYTEAAQLLLVRGADIDATDECGYSALHLAAEHGYFDLVKLLLEQGAKVDHREETGELFPRYDIAFRVPFSSIFFALSFSSSLSCTRGPFPSFSVSICSLIFSLRGSRSLVDIDITRNSILDHIQFRIVRSCRPWSACQKLTILAIV